MTFVIFLAVCFLVFLKIIIKRKTHFNFKNLPIQIANIETDCRFQSKKCPQGSIKCDCKHYCKNEDAKIYKTNGNYMCYIPYYFFKCKQEYGSYVFDETFKSWKCVPKYPGVFTTSGEQIAGKYPYAKAISIAKNVDYNDPSQYKVDCAGLSDEYGNKLIKVTLNRGVSFCVKDYCLNGVPNNPASGYNINTGLCDCTNGTRNLDSGDKTTPCVMSHRSFTHQNTPFIINCYKEDSYLKDVLSNYLIHCPDGEDYVASKEHDIKIVKMYS